jgi:hypothetical protein
MLGLIQQYWIAGGGDATTVFTLRSQTNKTGWQGFFMGEENS